MARKSQQAAPEPDEFDHAEAWRPEEGDIIKGTITRLDKGYSEYGDYPIVTIRQGDGTERAVHAFHTSLRRDLSDLRPKVGDDLAIKYFGEHEPKHGRNKFHKYKVRSDAAASTSVWDTPQSQPQQRQQVMSDVTPAEDDIPF